MTGAESSVQWRPIATAPKDGTYIIVGFDFATAWIVHVAWYRTAEDCVLNEWPATDEGWWTYPLHSVTQEQLSAEDHRAPTHWIPLPEVPK